jgi:predicted NAD/FAD-dependent oxidoreductase
VISQVAPSYAPPGRSLVSVSLVGHSNEADEAIEREVRGQLEEWFGTQVTDWRLLRLYRIRQALPDLPPRGQERPLPVLETGPGVIVCGDHLERGSIEGAMLSGRAAAERILGCG